MFERPVAQHHAADQLAGWDRAKAARVEAVDTVIAHEEVLIRPECEGLAVVAAEGLRAVDIRLVEQHAVDQHRAVAQLNCVARQADRALDQRILHRAMAF